MYEIDPNIFKLDDERIRALEREEISKADFLKLITPEDPFVLNQGRLILISAATREIQRKRFIVGTKEALQQHGGIIGDTLIEYEELFVECYPEIGPLVQKINEEIKEEQCVGCAKARKYNRLANAIRSIKYDGRDLSPLEPHLPHYALKKLKGEPFTITEDDIIIPPHLSAINSITLTRGKKLTKNSFGAVREFCRDCVLKHLSKALIFAREIAQGYTKENGHDHEYYMLANLDEAIDEGAGFKYIAEKINWASQKYEETNNISNLIQSIKKIQKRIVKEEYKEREWTVVGLLSEAEDILIDEDNQLHEDIRKIRLKLMGQKDS